MTRILGLIAIGIALLSPGAEACTCRDSDLPENEKIQNAIERSKYVVLARVTAIEASTPSDQGIARVTGAFQSIETFKGGDLATISISGEYRDGAFSSSCGEGLPNLSVGDVALLYLSNPAVDDWTFGYCSRSRVLQAPYDDSEVAQLRGKKLRIND